MDATSDRNAGYIASFWDKLGRWDPTLDRKAGGVFPVDDFDLGYATFHISNASSVMALVRAVVGHVMRSNSVPEQLAAYFKSLKITWLFAAQACMLRRPVPSFSSSGLLVFYHTLVLLAGPIEFMFVVVA